MIVKHLKTRQYCLNHLQYSYVWSYGNNFHFFQNQIFQISSKNTIRGSNSLDPGQAPQNVGSDLGPNCL